ncbi:MAG: exosortase C-terminal domain/associated protein EpsI [Candidatus Zipacnadales bacterium]
MSESDGRVTETAPVASLTPQPRVGALGALAGILLLGLGGVVTQQITTYPSASTVPPEALPHFEEVPYVIGDWKGYDDPLTARELGMLKLDAVLARTYKNADSEVRLIVEAHLGPFREGFHYPTVCMAAHGWSTMESGTAVLQSSEPGRPPEMTWLFMTQAGQYMLVSYWLWTPEGYVEAAPPFWRRASAVGTWERLKTANPRGTLFLAYTPVKRLDRLKAAIATQIDLANQLLPFIEKVLKDAVVRIEAHEKEGKLPVAQE